jgi:hypothetical protein
MNEILEHLLRLQDLDFDPKLRKSAGQEAAALREKIPPQILGHYDRLVARGKKGVALVSNQVCRGCNMRVPIGTVNTLMQAKDIQLCDSCGRYLALAPQVQEEAPAPAPPKAKRAKRVPKEKVIA